MKRFRAIVLNKWYAVSHYFGRLSLFWLTAASVIFLLALNQFILYKLQAYNSDDVALTLMAQHFDVHMLPSWMPPDTFFLKLPFNALAQALMPGTRGALFLSAFMALAVSVLIFIYVSYRVAQHGKRRVDRLRFWLVHVAFIATPSFVYMFSVRSPQIRTIEIGLCALFLWVIARQLETKKRRPLWQWGLFSVLLGGFFYNDPAFLFFIAVPALLLAGIDYLENLTKNSGKLIIAVGLSVVIYKLIEVVLNSIGLRVYDTDSSFIALDKLGNVAVAVTGGLLKLFNGDFFGGGVNSPRTLISIIYAALFMIMVVSIYHVMRRGNYSEKIFAIAIITCVATLLFSTRMADVYSARYMTIIPFFSSIVVYAALGYPSVRRWMKRAITIALLVVIAGNLAVPIYKTSALATRPASINPNQLNEDVIKALSNNPEYKKGYAGYFMANINTYLGKFQKPINPVLCFDNGVRIFHWVMYDGYISEPSSKSYIIVSDDNMLPAITTIGEDVMCKEDEIVRLIGPYARKTDVRSGTSVLFYDFDIAQKFGVRTSLRWP